MKHWKLAVIAALWSGALYAAPMPVVVSFSILGDVDKLQFEFASSDTGDYGVNTPTYVCIDNIEFVQTFEK